VAKLSLKIDVIGQIGALDFAVIHIIGFLDQTQACFSDYLHIYGYEGFEAAFLHRPDIPSNAIVPLPMSPAGLS